MNRYSPWWNGFVFGMLFKLALILCLSWFGHNIDFSRQSLGFENITPSSVAAGRYTINSDNTLSFDKK